MTVLEGKERAKVSKLVATQCLEAIRPNSLAQKAGLRRGDYVLAVCASDSMCAGYSVLINRKIYKCYVLQKLVAHVT